MRVSDFHPRISNFGVKVVDLGVGMWVSDCNPLNQQFWRQSG